jgi:transposase InsO family protein
MELRKKSWQIGQKRVARIMREHGIKAVKATLYRSRPGMLRHVYKIPCRIADMAVTRENQLWVGDVTYIKLRDGTCQYLCTIMDRHNRKIISKARNLLEYPFCFNLLEDRIRGMKRQNENASYTNVMCANEELLHECIENP